jgi:predicted transcriptional regulator
MEKFCNEAYYRFFTTLANRTNLAIIDALKDAPKSQSEISDSLGIDTKAISGNFTQLQECALVHVENTSGVKRYSINREIVVPLGELVAFHAAKHCPEMRECIPEGKLREYLKKEASKETYIEH